MLNHLLLLLAILVVLGVKVNITIDRAVRVCPGSFAGRGRSRGIARRAPWQPKIWPRVNP